MYSRLQHVCVLALRCSVLSVGKVVGQHGVHQLVHLLLLSAAEQLWIHLEQTTDDQLHAMKLLLMLQNASFILKSVCVSTHRPQFGTDDVQKQREHVQGQDVLAGP